MRPTLKTGVGDQREEEIVSLAGPNAKLRRRLLLTFLPDQRIVSVVAIVGISKSTTTQLPLEELVTMLREANKQTRCQLELSAERVEEERILTCP